MKSVGKVDKGIVIPTAIIYLVLFACILIAPQQTGEVFSSIIAGILDSGGFVYVLIYAAVLIAFFIIGFSRFGKYKLGKQDDKPDYSFLSWMGMLFGAGLGVGLVFYGVTEPVSHYLTAPFTVDATAEAARESMQITFFHWGFTPWCLYGMVGLCMAFFMHCKGLPCLVSSTFYPLIGERVNGWMGKAINVLSLVALICGASMSLGFAATQFTSGLGFQFNLPTGFIAVTIVALIIGVLSVGSALSGVEKGIKFISDLNLGLVFFLLLFVLLFGSTVYLIQGFCEGWGDYLINLPWMMFFTDNNATVADKVGFDWCGSWTMMYWAWWAAFAPFVGGFLARISRGRTIKEFVLACAIVPAVLCFAWFAFFGGEAIHLDLFDGVSGLAASIVADTDNSLYLMLQQLPFSQVIIPCAMLLVITLIVTTVNSATYVAGQVSSGGDYVPSFAMRMFWGIFIVANGILFIYLGGLDILKNAAILLAFPFTILVAIMVVALFKALKKYDPEEAELLETPGGDGGEPAEEAKPEAELDDAAVAGDVVTACAAEPEKMPEPA